MPVVRQISIVLLILPLSFNMMTLAQDTGRRSASLNTHPNVVLILADDQGWGDLRLHGNQRIETPHLDGLAKSGLRLTNFYVSPLCAPTRASILTGRYSLRTGVISVSKGLENMNTEENTLAELFRANGYKTGIFGKWHNGEHYPNRPNDQGFDEFLGFCAGHLTNYFDPELDHNDKAVKTKGYITNVLTEAAIEFIETNKEKPFFCYIPFNAPHSPHQVPDRYFDKYKAKGLDDETASIYGMVDNMDENVGRILDHLKKSGLDRNTIVIFLSDNGPNGTRYNGNMKGIKGSVHEGGVKVPFFIRWNGAIPTGKIISTPSAHIDIYPTLLDLCKLKPSSGKPIDGISLASLILQGSDESRSDRNLFAHVNFMTLPVTLNAGGFRNDQYRFVFEKDRPQLYDLTRDSSQLNDLSLQKPQQSKQFLEQYKQWFTAVTAELISDRSTILSPAGVELPVYEATLTGGIKFKEGHAWAHDWVEKWNSPQDSMYWEINCIKGGQYRIELDYLCKPGDEGSRIECSVGNIKKEAVVEYAFYSTQIPSPDRVPRKEAYEMSEWKKLPIDTFTIPKGKHVISIKAIHVAKANVAEIKCLRVLRVDD
jgi:arylsulfatase A-like enzyme